MATRYNCKYIETSVALNHNVDQLLAGIIRQVRSRRQSSTYNPECEMTKDTKTASMFTKILLQKLMKIGHPDFLCTRLFDVWRRGIPRWIRNGWWYDLHIIGFCDKGLTVCTECFGITEISVQTDMWGLRDMNWVTRKLFVWWKSDEINRRKISSSLHSRSDW